MRGILSHARDSLPRRRLWGRLSFDALREFTGSAQGTHRQRSGCSEAGLLAWVATRPRSRRHTMKPKKRTVAAVTSAVLVLGVGAGLADAAHNSGIRKAGIAGLRGPGPGTGGQAIADYLGLTAAELRTQLG